MPEMGRSGERRRGVARSVSFDPDPGRLVGALEHFGAALDLSVGLAPGVVPSHAFPVLRPLDLVAFHVRGSGLRLEADDDGPALAPAGEAPRLEINRSFQHLGERAFFPSNPLPGPNPSEEATEAPPIYALAARPSRLLFDVPEGERIGYSVAEVLAAISPLLLRFALLATPRSLSGALAPGDFTHVASLAAGYQLVRRTDGLLPFTSAESTPVQTALSSVRAVLEEAQALSTARAVLAGDTSPWTCRRGIRAGGRCLRTKMQRTAA